MPEENTSNGQAEVASLATRAGVITAPYFDLDSSVKVAEAIHNNGGGTCTPDQLAHWLGYTSIRSGTYLTRVSAANKHFGLIDSLGEHLTLTERAKKIITPVMPDDTHSAKVEAFLAVSLFSKIYERFRGGQIPPELGLKNLFKNEFKMPSDRVGPSVRVFLNSAEQAGLLTADRTRLIRPNFGGASLTQPVPQKHEYLPTQEKHKSSGGGVGEIPTGGVHGAIIGLLRDLPPPGTSWPAQKKKRFLDAFKATVDFIYPDPEEESS